MPAVRHLSDVVDDRVDLLGICPFVVHIRPHSRNAYCEVPEYHSVLGQTGEALWPGFRRFFRAAASASADLDEPFAEACFESVERLGNDVLTDTQPSRGPLLQHRMPFGANPRQRREDYDVGHPRMPESAAYLAPYHRRAPTEISPGAAYRPGMDGSLTVGADGAAADLSAGIGEMSEGNAGHSRVVATDLANSQVRFGAMARCRNSNRAFRPSYLKIPEAPRLAREFARPVSVLHVKRIGGWWLFVNGVRRDRGRSRSGVVGSIASNRVDRYVRRRTPRHQSASSLTAGRLFRRANPSR